MTSVRPWAEARRRKDLLNHMGEVQLQEKGLVDAGRALH